jgi:hypothetical protein
VTVVSLADFQLNYHPLPDCSHRVIEGVTCLDCGQKINVPVKITHSTDTVQQLLPVPNTGLDHILQPRISVVPVGSYMHAAGCKMPATAGWAYISGDVDASASSQKLAYHFCMPADGGREKWSLAILQHHAPQRQMLHDLVWEEIQAGMCGNRSISLKATTSRLFDLQEGCWKHQ